MTGDGVCGKNVLYSTLDGLSTSYLLLFLLLGTGLPIMNALRVAICCIIGLSTTHALRDYFRAAAESELYCRERERESWELKNYEEGEVKEMVELWQMKGLPKENAETALNAVLVNKDFFLDLMMREELELFPPAFPPWQVALSTFFGFFLSGITPLIIFRLFLAFPRFLPGGLSLDAVVNFRVSGDWASLTWQLFPFLALALALPLFLVEWLRAWSVPLLHSITAIRMQARAFAAATIALPVFFSLAALAMFQINKGNNTPGE